MVQWVYFLYSLNLGKIVDIIQVRTSSFKIKLPPFANRWHTQHLPRSDFLPEEARRRKFHSIMIQLVHKTLFPQYVAYHGLDWRKMPQKSAPDNTNQYSSPIKSRPSVYRPNRIMAFELTATKICSKITSKCSWKWSKRVKLRQDLRSSALWLPTFLKMTRIWSNVNNSDFLDVWSSCDLT